MKKRPYIKKIILSLCAIVTIMTVKQDALAFSFNGTTPSSVHYYSPQTGDVSLKQIYYNSTLVWTAQTPWTAYSFTGPDYSTEEKYIYAFAPCDTGVTELVHSGNSNALYCGGYTHNGSAVIQTPPMPTKGCSTINITLSSPDSNNMTITVYGYTNDAATADSEHVIAQYHADWWGGAATFNVSNYAAVRVNGRTDGHDGWSSIKVNNINFY